MASHELPPRWLRATTHTSVLVFRNEKLQRERKMVCRFGEEKNIDWGSDKPWKNGWNAAPDVQHRPQRQQSPSPKLCKRDGCRHSKGRHREDQYGGDVGRCRYCSCSQYIDNEVIADAAVLVGTEQKSLEPEVLSGATINLNSSEEQRMGFRDTVLRAQRVLAIRESWKKYCESDHCPKTEFSSKHLMAI